MFESLVDKLLEPKKEALLGSLRRNGISEPTVAAIASLNRREFTPRHLWPSTWDDRPLPLSDTSSLSQPYTVGFMTDLLDPRPGDHVLEVGTATGWQAAIIQALVGMTGEVTTVEVDEGLAATAKLRLNKLGINGVDIRVGDGTLMQEPEGGFDRLIVTAAMFPTMELPLYDSLKPGGRCVVPIGGVGGVRENTTMTVMEKGEDGMEIVRAIGGFSFVAAQGKLGWNSIEAGLRMNRHMQLFTNTPIESDDYTP